MTEAQKDAIREERKVLTLEQIGRRYGYTRERIRQVCNELPNEDKRAREQGAGLGSFERLPMPAVSRVVTQFTRRRDRHLEDLELQLAIRKDRCTLHEAMRKYGLTLGQVAKIRTVPQQVLRPIKPVTTREQRKAAGNEKCRATWQAKSEEEKLAHGEGISRRLRKWWAEASPERRAPMLEHLRNIGKKARAARLERQT